MNDELVLNNVNLIYYVLKRLELFDKKELYEEIGMIALVKASKKYNPTLNYKFSTLAVKYITNEILRHIQIQNYKKRKCNDVIISLDDFILNEQRMYHDVIADKYNLEEEFIKKEKIDFLYRCLDMLDKEQQFIIKSYFGLEKAEKLTQKEIGEKLNISPQMVRHKMRQGFKIIKKIMEEKYD